MIYIMHSGTGLDGVSLQKMEPRALGPHDCRVALRAAALNHRDIWTCRGRAPDAPPVILGSDGAGVVEAVGRQVRHVRPGDHVVVNPSLGWLSGIEAPPDGFEILGHPTHGTFAETLVIPATNVEPKPEHLSWHEAAALPLSGLTAYRALFTRGRVKAGDTIVIPGIGGGTALAALQFAKASGASVIATTSKPEKQEKARAAGADLVLDTVTPWAEAVRQFTGGRGADVVIESVGRASWQNSLAALARGGRIVVYGSTSGDVVETDLVPLFLGWQSILGTTMGNRDEFRAMLKLVTVDRLRPIIDRVFPLREGPAALRYLEAGGQFGKVVLEIG